MAPIKSSLARAGTMELTATEGIDYLKASRKLTLLKFQGLFEDEPKVKRDNSMVRVAKEAELLLGGSKPDAQTRGQQKRIAEEPDTDEDADSLSEPPRKKMRLCKNTTMKMTDDESIRYMLPSKPRQKTRQQRLRAKSRHTLKKSTTIARTIEEAKYVLYGYPGTNEAVTTRSQRGKNSSRLYLGLQ